MDWDSVDDYFNKIEKFNMAAKVVERKNITAVIREYEKDGEMKKVRRTIGEITTFQSDDGSYFQKGELYHMPGAQIDIYKQKPKEDSNY